MTLSMKCYSFVGEGNTLSHFIDSYPHIDRSGSNVSIDERRIIIVMMHLYKSTYLTESSLGCQSSQWKYVIMYFTHLTIQ